MIVDFPKKLAFLFEPAPYKIAYGGRDGTKSWGFAAALLELAARRCLRVLCVRETQTSISASVHQLLEDTIKRLQMQRKYEVQQTTIRGLNGSEFIFAGLKHNIDNIKSLEGADMVWAEEAHSISKESWDKLLPTLRKKNAEVWVSFNPDLETDDTYMRWVINPPPGAIVVKIGWEDNRWLSDISKARIEHMRNTDPEGFRHIYGGECRSAVKGAIYGEELKLVAAQGRISNIPCDRTRPVDTFWDLGFEDKTAIWFGQAYGGWYNFIDYLEDQGRTIEWYLIQLQQRGYVYGTDWLPHDSLDTIIHRKLGGIRDRSIEMILRDAGRKIGMVPKMYVLDGINAARTFLPQCRFDETKCYEGLRALRMYQWGPPPASGRVRREPLHDAASHGADGFRSAAICFKQPVDNDDEKSYSVPGIGGQFGWMA